MATTQVINLDEARNLLVKAGLADAANMLTTGIEVIDVTCTAAGYEKRAPNTAVLTRQPDPHDHAAGSSCSTCTKSVSDCNPTVRTLQQLMQQGCGQVFDPCWADQVAMSIALFRSIPEVKAFIGRTKARLIRTGVTGTITDGEGDSSTLVANYPVTPGQSILLRMEDFPFPFPVECLSGVLAFAGGGGTLEENYQQVILKAYVGQKSVSVTNTALGEAWNDAELSYGSELRCGDGCRSIFLKGQAGCGPSSVGMLSELRILITNKATATANITRHQLQIHMGGLKKYCCEACAVGIKSACSCKA